MQPLKKYLLLESSVMHTASQETIELWKSKLTEFILTCTDSSAVTLLSINPAASNIGDDIGKCTKGALGSKKYLISYVHELKRNMVTDLLNDSDFYLGHTLLAKGVLSSAKCNDLLISWDSYLLNTGYEFFKMGADGFIFYWYNPSNINPEWYLLGE